MFAPLCKAVVVLAVVLNQHAAAQQFAGDTIPNTLPWIPGSEVAFWKIKDPAGTTGTLNMTNYWSLQNDGARPVPSNVRRAVIVIHGLQRDAGTYMSNIMSALSAVSTDANINRSTVQLVAPLFPNGDDKNTSYPYYSYSGTGTAYSGGKQSNTSALVWKGSTWISGQSNQYPVKYNTTSPYDCIDQMLQYFDNKTLYPSLNQIVVAGHSAGSQTVNRYAAVQKALGLKTTVTFWLGNPNNWLWLNASRPFDASSCSTYDAWRDGLSNYAASGMLYNTALVAQGSAAVTANFQAQNKAYARGMLDQGDDSSTCAPFTTGKDRHERFFEFINWWPASCPSPNVTKAGRGHCDTLDLIDAGHDAGAMFASPAGIARLFIDNFYGDGSRAYDFGYPRRQVGDDPFPNPTQANATIPGPSNGVYAGNMTYAGCWTDSGTARALLTMAYDSSSNTVELCTQTCSSMGYRVAGLEFGSQCFCDNYIDPSSVRALDVSCSQTCAGNTNETCGSASRLSVYANGTLSGRPIAGNPATLLQGSYSYAGCYGEATSGRALSATTFSDGTNMTLEKCVDFCLGYQYFGVEYASECYCGSYLNAGSGVIANSSCSMTCSGNSLQSCGGSYALTVYTLSPGANVTVISQGSGGSTGTSSSTISTKELCPSADGRIVADTNNATYLVYCSSDSSVNSYGGSQATESYLDCMALCDAAVPNGCIAFTYVGGIGGSGSGTCWLKTGLGSTISQSGNYISAVRVSNSSLTSSSTSSSTVSPSSSSTRSATAMPSASGFSLCPAANGQNITDTQGYIYTVSCSSDSTWGAFSNAAASSSYLDCMVACDGTTSCTAFTYVGGNYGSGSGTCWLKTTMGAATSASVNYISAARAGSGSASSPSSSSSSAVTCPAANQTTYTASTGSKYLIECGIDRAGGDLSSTTVIVGDLAACIAACASTHGCVDVSLSGAACYLKSSVMAGSLNSGVNGAVLITTTTSSTVATVRSASTTTSSSASLSPSTAFPFTTLSTSKTLLTSTMLSSPTTLSSSMTLSSSTTLSLSTKVSSTTPSFTTVSSSTLPSSSNTISSTSTPTVFTTSVSSTAPPSSSETTTTQAITSVASTSSSTITLTTTSSVAIATTSSSKPTTSSSSSATTSTSSTTYAATSSSSLSSTSTAAPSSLPTDFVSLGCFVDKSRPLAVSNGTSTTNSPKQCALNCRGLGYKYSGTEYSNECWCGNYLPPTSAPASECKMACTGDSTQACGAGSRLSVVQDTAWVQKLFARGNYSTWNLLGCYVDSASARVVPKSVATLGGSKNMTIANCMDACRKAGYVVCGAEYYGECYGSNAQPRSTSLAGAEPLQAGCDYPCYGNATEACGGASRILVYTNNGA